MNFKPTKWKLIVTIAVLVLWYFFIIWSLSKIMCDCVVNLNDCEKVFRINIIPGNGCNCSCPIPTPISKIFGDLLLILF